MTRYDALVAQRRELGQQRYGDVYLAPGWDFATPLQVEAADTINYLALERDRLRHRDPGTLARGWLTFGRLDNQAKRFAALARGAVGALAPAAACDIAELTGARMAEGHRRFGCAHLERPNLPEALEEIADAQILCELELRRRAHHGTLAPWSQTVLDLVAGRAHQLGRDFAAATHTLARGVA